MIPVCRPWLPGKEREYVNQALEDNWISADGPYVSKFEDKFAQFCENKYDYCSSLFAIIIRDKSLIKGSILRRYLLASQIRKSCLENDSKTKDK